MSDKGVNNVLNVTMEKIKEMVDVNTIIGEAIHVQEGVTIIPVSSVKYGFAGGGSDLPTKNQPTSGESLFAGGSGSAVTITPIAFLVVSDGNVKVLQIEPYTSSVDRAIEKIPDVFDKISSLVGKKDDTPTVDEKTEPTFI